MRSALNRGPDGLLSVAQIVRCVTETPQLTSRFGSSAILSFRRLVSTAIGATAFVSVRDRRTLKGLFRSL